MRKIWSLLIVVILFFAYLFLPIYLVKEKYPLEYSSIIIKESEANDLSPALIASLIYNESRFKEQAISNRNAIGLMQIQYPTAKGVYQKSLSKDQLKQPEINIEIGSKYLKRLVDHYSDVETAIIAYNVGITVVDNALKKGEGLEQFSSSKQFAQNVLKVEKIYAKIYTSQLELESNTKGLSAYQMWSLLI